MTKYNSHTWKPIKGFPSYFINKAGEVVVDKAAAYGAFQGARFKPVKRTKRKDGTQMVVLKDAGGKPSRVLVAPLMLRIWFPHIKQGECVIHKDHDKTNCELGNLMYATKKEKYIHDRKGQTAKLITYKDGEVTIEPYKVERGVLHPSINN